MYGTTKTTPKNLYGSKQWGWIILAKTKHTPTSLSKAARTAQTRPLPSSNTQASRRWEQQEPSSTRITQMNLQSAKHKATAITSRPKTTAQQFCCSHLQLLPLPPPFSSEAQDGIPTPLIKETHRNMRPTQHPPPRKHLNLLYYFVHLKH